MSQIIIKIGGELFQRDGLLSAIAQDIQILAEAHKLLMIHGGGPQATALQRALGQEVRVQGGRRITDQAALEVMKMALGRLNMDLCSALMAAGARPVGLHGASTGLIAGEKRPPRLLSGCGPEPLDFGLVGDVSGFNLPLLKLLQEAGFLPVLACLAANEQGQLLNINGDTVANQAAVVLEADQLLLLTSAPGVLRDLQDPNSRLSRLSISEARRAIAEGVIQGGMIPKVETSIRSLESGAVKAVHILGPSQKGDLLRAIEQPGSLGTVLGPDPH